MGKKLRNKLKNGKFSSVSPKTSKTMSKIKGKNNKSTEMILKMYFVRNKIAGWKTNYKFIPGKPDFYFKKRKLAVFVDGCFWHGCPKCGHIPKTNSMFWKTKILLNKKRDINNNKILKKEGIKYLRVWEHQLNNKNIYKVIDLLKLKLK